MDLKNKVAIVTGAASGIGYAIANALAEAGASVVIADIDSAGGARASDELQRLGPAGLFVKTNVAEAADVRRMVDATIEKFGRLEKSRLLV